MGADTWAGLADEFADGAYASVKGRVRTYVVHRQLLDHLPEAPARVLDVGGGAGHQSLPLAEVGYEVTLLDASEAMLDKARHRLEHPPERVQQRATLLRADGENAEEVLQGRLFDAVLCHGVLGYQDSPEPLVEQLCRCVRPGGVVSIVTGNAAAMAVRPALEQRWEDALAAFDTTCETGILGVATRADALDELVALMRERGVHPLDWYGVWLFTDWFDLSGAALDPDDAQQLQAAAEVELEAGKRDPYRQLSRLIHLLGRKSED